MIYWDLCFEDKTTLLKIADVNVTKIVTQNVNTNACTELTDYKNVSHAAFGNTSHVMLPVHTNWSSIQAVMACNVSYLGLVPWIDFTNGLWDHYWNLLKFLVAVMLIVMIKSDHDVAHVTTVQLLWHVQDVDLFGSLFIIWQWTPFHEIWYISSYTVCKMGPCNPSL